jgi:lysophospholipase L1-like esterase
MQEDKEAVFDAVDTLRLCLTPFIPMLKTMRVLKENMRNAAARGFINATDCADYLVAAKGLPFRDAYKITGQLVAICIDRNLTLETLPLDEYKKLVGEIFDKCDKAGVKVIVLTATMIFENQKGKLNQMLIPYNQWLREEAKRRNYPLADLNADMQSELERIRQTDKTAGNKLTCDGVHMGYKGDVLMAWGVLRAMGAPEADKSKFYEMCDTIPGAHRLSVEISVDEKRKLDKLLKEKSMTANDYLRSLLFDVK